MFHLCLWWALESGPPLCHVPFFRAGTSAPCLIDMKPQKDEPNLQIICSEVPQPVHVAWIHTETSSSCISSFIATVPTYQAYTSSPRHSLLCLPTAAAAAKSLQSCPTLCDPIDGSPPGSSVPGILQARTLEWVAISFSSAGMHAMSLQSCPTLCDSMDSSPPGSYVHRIL